jgi:hypothetical protein
MRTQTNPRHGWGSCYGSLLIFLAMRFGSAVAAPEPGTDIRRRSGSRAKIRRYK